VAGEAGMQLRGPTLGRWLLRRTVLPWMLRGRPIPPRVRAPVETRPAMACADQAVAVATLETLASQFMGEFAARQAAGPVWLTHAYFGRLPALEALRFVTIHTRHHTCQLAGAAA